MTESGWSPNEKEVYALMRSWNYVPKDAEEFVDSYLKGHLRRFTRTLGSIPNAAGNSAKLLDVGGLANMIPCYQKMLGYLQVTLGTRDDSPFSFVGDEMRSVEVSYFDAELDRFPFEDDKFDTVVCLEVIEHLTMDPMHMMSEINRVCRPGGYVVMTTPNTVGWKALGRVVSGEHPSGWSYYSGYHCDRHNREYTPGEMGLLLRDAGFDVSELSTFSQSGLQAAHRWLRYLLIPLKRFWELPGDAMRGDFIIAVGRKAGGVRTRLPDWLYGGYKEDRELLASQGKYDGPVS